MYGFKRFLIGNFASFGSYSPPGSGLSDVHSFCVRFFKIFGMELSGRVCPLSVEVLLLFCCFISLSPVFGAMIPSLSLIGPAMDPRLAQERCCVLVCSRFGLFWFLRCFGVVNTYAPRAIPGLPLLHILLVGVYHL